MHKAVFVRQFGLSAVVAIIALIMLFPILITFTNALMSEQEIGFNYNLLGKMIDVTAGQKNAFVNLKLIPDWVSLEQFNQVLIKNPVFLKMFWNSVAMVVPIIVGQLIVASYAAYAFVKLRFPGRDKLFFIYLITMLTPFQVTLVPNYLIAEKLGLLNTAAAIILPGMFSAFGVFMLRQFMLHIPTAYIEAAKMDGAGHWVIFHQLILPMIKPGLAALLVLLFVDYWNMVEQPLIFLEDSFKQPLSLYLSRINQEARGVSFAASVLYMAPIVLLFAYAQSYFIRGIQLSGIKG
ncbi:carbohydrate ABC transporter permease [Paenibacillus oryzisoli]|uniref:Sugar ABC transporter permease n=1 Tax=Paenibacillus oryzisoli TaxID=1850517 RepID=A0A198A0X2_9BACL|nr:carbohydrate ABC transporter permease [Paenibacillus oryzisoli]OAS14830.1 sugar ABC transporter permease [Paenibacillus oryzisoli]